MAISGNGTSANPYLVHSYEEIKAVCTNLTAYPNYDTNDKKKYVRLENDINCNDYGDEFEWNGISLYDSAHSVPIVLDLNSKTIKNVMITQNSFLFKGYANSSLISIIKNGKLLNIFCNAASSIIASNSGGNEINTIFTNVSISTNINTVTSYAFCGCEMNCCSVYVKADTLKNSVFYYRSSTGIVYDKCDFLFDFENVTANKLLFEQSYYTNNFALNMCRIRGKYPNGFPRTRGLVNCVWDLTCKSTGYYNSYAGLFDSCTGVFNKSKIQGDYYITASMVACTDEEIKNADVLNAKGFTVVEVEVGE